MGTYPIYLAALAALPGFARATVCVQHAISWAVSPAPGVILVAKSNGAAVSHDHGQSWSPLAVPDAGGDLVLSVGKAVYLSGERGLFRSTDFGRNWQMLGQRRHPAVAGDGQVYACTPQGDAVERMDGQGRWHPTAQLDKRHVISESVPDKRGGWTQVTTTYDINGRKTVTRGGEPPVFMWPGPNACEQVMAGGGAIVVAGSDALYVSLNRGKSWQGVPQDSSTRAPYRMDGSGALFAQSTQEGEYIIKRSKDHGRSWQLLPATRGFQLSGADGQGVLLGRGKTLYRLPADGTPTELTALPDDHAYVRPGAGLIVARSELMLRGRDGEWQRIHGQTMGGPDWMTCH